MAPLHRLLEEARAQALHRRVKIVVGQPQPIVAGQVTQSPGQVGTGGIVEAEIVDQDRDDVAPQLHGVLNFTPQPIVRLLAPFQRAVRQDHQEVRPGRNLGENDRRRTARYQCSPRP